MYQTYLMLKPLRKLACKSLTAPSSRLWVVVPFTRSGNILLCSKYSTETIHGTSRNMSSSSRKLINVFTCHLFDVCSSTSCASARPRLLGPGERIRKVLKHDLGTNQLNLNNPPRRDKVMLPASGWVVIAFKTDNPGVSDFRSFCPD